MQNKKFDFIADFSKPIERDSSHNKMNTLSFLASTLIIVLAIGVYAFTIVMPSINNQTAKGIDSPISQEAQNLLNNNKMAGKVISQVDAGMYDTCAIKNNKLYCWGNGQYGKLGLGNTNFVLSPTLVSALPGMVRKVSAGDISTCAITVVSGVNQLYCWGDNSYGQLGIGNNNGGFYMTPQQVTIPGDVKEVSVSDSHACAITKINTLNKLYCWGNNASGELGINNNVNMYGPKAVIYLPGNVQEVSTGGSFVNNFTCAITKVSGIDKLYCWGDNMYGQLGLGNYNSFNKPKLVSYFNGYEISNIRTENIDACILGNNDSTSTNKKMYCWGHNLQGQLGTGNTIATNTPILTSLPAGFNPVEIMSSRFGHNCSIMVDNTTNNNALYCWGLNSLGQLGDGNISLSNQYVPEFINTLPSTSTIKGAKGTFSGGTLHTCIITNNGVDDELYCWGSNQGGELGDGTAQNFNPHVNPVLTLL